MSAPTPMPAKTVQEPIFLLGAHRSGTTLLGLMLRGHSTIGWMGEFEYAVDFIDATTGEFPDRSEFERALNTDRRFRARGFQLDPELSPRELADSMLTQTMESQQKPRIGAAMHRHFERALDLWPDARVIHLLRDGRDVALSRIKLGWAGNVWSSAPAWAEIEESWDALHPPLAPEQVHEVRYEELVAEPERELSHICTFLGIDYEPNMLRYPDRSNYAPPDPTLSQQWRSRLSLRECQLLDHAIGELLDGRGYSQGSGHPAAPTLLERGYFSLQDWASRLAWRFRRYGAQLVLSEFVTRRFGLTRRNHNIRLKIDAIAERHLR